MKRLSHRADYGFTIYVRNAVIEEGGGDAGYMAAYINYPSGGARDLPDGQPTEETLEKILNQIREIVLGETGYLD